MAKKKKPVDPVYCQNCDKEIEKKKYESRNRYADRKYCSTTCAKDYMREHEIGWFSPKKQTIKHKKSKQQEIDDWQQKKQLRQLEREYPELAHV